MHSLETIRRSSEFSFSLPSSLREEVVSLVSELGFLRFQQADIVELAIQLVTPNMKKEEKIVTINALEPVLAIREAQRREVVTSALKILVPIDRSYDYIPYLLRYLDSKKTSEIVDIIEWTMKLIEGEDNESLRGNGEARCGIFEQIASISFDERPSFIAHVQQLVCSRFSSPFTLDVIRFLQGVDSLEREILVRDALELLSPIEYRGKDIVKTLDRLARIDRVERDHIMQHVRLLIKNQKTSFDRISIFLDIEFTAKDQRAEYVRRKISRVS